MSSEMSTRRGYELRKRARTQEETRRRIVDAVISLHEEVGPARTTVVEIADRAQVSRPTVYSHFPDERSLIAACSGHWMADNSPPDPAAWASITDPRERTRLALGELYAYYAPRERMLSNVLRDAALMWSVSEAVEQNFGRYSEAATDVLASGWGANRDPRWTRAALELALDFHTWQTLTQQAGLGNDESAELMAALVEAA